MEFGSKQINFFLTVMTVSLVGNACANYALLWYTISEFPKLSNAGGHDATGLFYIGQAVGVIFIAPLLSVFFDKFSKRIASAALDLIYAMFLGILIACYQYNRLSPEIILLMATLIMAVSTLHMSSVGFSAIQKASSKENVTGNVSKFVAANTTSFLLGAALSGIVYKWIGFTGCMIIGIITFIPTIYVYFKIFPKDEIINSNPLGVTSVFSQLGQGFSTLFNDKVLFWSALSVAIINIPGAVFPAVLGISFEQSFPGRSDFFTIAIAGGILIGTILTKKLGELSKKMAISKIIPISSFPVIASLILCWYQPHPISFSVLFVSACCSSAMRNVCTGSLRVTRIPQEMMGRTNTAYAAMLFIGQFLGGLLIIPSVKINMQSSILLMLGLIIFAGFISLLFLPRQKLQELVGEKK